MNLPGLITVQPDRTEELDALARMVGTCFLEEMWYVTWLEALDELGIGRDRKLEITRAVIRSDLSLIHISRRRARRRLPWTPRGSRRPRGP